MLRCSVGPCWGAYSPNASGFHARSWARYGFHTNGSLWPKTSKSRLGNTGVTRGAAARGPFAGLGRESDRELVQEPVRELDQERDKELDQEPVRELEQEPVREPNQELVREFEQEPVQELDQEPVQ